MSQWSIDTQERQSNRQSNLMHAFCIELAARMPLIIQDDPYELSGVYKQVLGALDQEVDLQLYDEMMNEVDELFEHVHSRAHLVRMILLYKSEELAQYVEDGRSTLHEYNKPLNAQTRDEINRSSADTIERLHLLKAYHVAPMVVSAEDVELPWDIVVSPPLKAVDGQELDEYDFGALADFYFLKPDPERKQALKRITPDPAHPHRHRATFEGSSVDMRLRLHDNGQISHGFLVHNIPGDQTEADFAASGAHNAFVRLRALMIAIAFDSMVPEEVIRDRVGGSVPQQYRALREQSPKGDVIPQIILGRLRELRAQNISHKNRQPRTWEKPQRPVVGHKKRLPEGMRRHPDAEEKARQHYEKLGKEFTGLEEGWNFVKGYTRGTLPEDTPYRRAHFKSRSHTMQLLGKYAQK